MTSAPIPSTFRHGVHPQEHKELTEHLPSSACRSWSGTCCRCRSISGRRASAVVKPGETVRRGQVIAEPGGFVSMALHAPVTGNRDGHRAEAPPERSTCRGDRDRGGSVRNAGIVAFAGRSTGSRMSVDEFVRKSEQRASWGWAGRRSPRTSSTSCLTGKRCEILLINGCECEPYLTCDHRLMVEHAGAHHSGDEIVATKLGADEAIIGVELNKPDA
jgi:electron transport complex protein RnfC